MLKTALLQDLSIHFTDDHFKDLNDIVLDCYNGSKGNPIIIFFMQSTHFSCRHIDDAFVFYTALNRWSHMPFPTMLKKSNCDIHHWHNLYLLYQSNKYKRRTTKLKKMFTYIAGIKLDY
jgi:hypothetical protein